MKVSSEFVRLKVEEIRLEQMRAERARRCQQDYSVFISYTHSDAAVAERIVSILERHGVRYRRDVKELHWASDIPEWVQTAIEESTHYLLILSKTSASAAWCNFEFGFAAGKGKILCVFQSEADASVPPFVRHVLVAKANFDEVERFFVDERITTDVLDGLVADLLGPAEAIDRLAKFARTDRSKEGHDVWIAADSEEILRASEARNPYVDRTADLPRRLLRIELGEAIQVPLVMGYGGGDFRPQDYALRYQPASDADDDACPGAVLVEPGGKPGADLVGIYERTQSGDVFRRGHLSLEEKLRPPADRRQAYGFDCSPDVWTRTLIRLRELLDS